MRSVKSDAVMFGPFRFDPGQGLWRDGREVPMPPRALGVLDALTRQPGMLISKAELLNAVWRDAFVTEASLLEAIRGDAGVLFTATTVTGSRLVRFDPGSGDCHPVLDGAAFGRYSPTGHLVFERAASSRRRRSPSENGACWPRRGPSCAALPRAAHRESDRVSRSRTRVRRFYVPGAPSTLEDQLQSRPAA